MSHHNSALALFAPGNSISPSTVGYEYDSRLPFMFNLIKGETDSKADARGMTYEQARLWGTVQKTRIRVLNDESFKVSDQAIQQFMLEFWIWDKHWPGLDFPGSYPTKIDLPNTMPQPSSSVVVKLQDTVSHLSTSSPVEHFPVILLTGDGETDRLRDEARAAILKIKGNSFVPFHGWDTKTGLPYYAIICTAVNGFQRFCGKGQEYFKVIRTHFYPVARIMYQRSRYGLMVIWIEAPTAEHAVLLNSNESAWRNFKECWAFLKSWSVMYRGKMAVDTVQYLKDWQAAVEVDLDNIELERPPIPQLRLSTRPDYWNTVLYADIEHLEGLIAEEREELEDCKKSANAASQVPLSINLEILATPSKHKLPQSETGIAKKLRLVPAAPKPDLADPALDHQTDLVESLTVAAKCNRPGYIVVGCSDSAKVRGDTVSFLQSEYGAASNVRAEESGYYLMFEDTLEGHETLDDRYEVIYDEIKEDKFFNNNVVDAILTSWREPEKGVLE
ncbi:histone methyltransferase [Marssonina coronariae]|uniref:Histone methyltransferase n=1 Tax=Diplocarpon coronariae TaxID=2795749 RepID=A0A218Z4Z3_9HELO|nr:histone methyltransferase [Marssonina coronariae]